MSPHRGETAAISAGFAGGEQLWRCRSATWPESRDRQSLVSVVKSNGFHGGRQKQAPVPDENLVAPFTSY